MTTPKLGLDIAKDKFDCVLLLNEQQHRRAFRNSLAGWKELDRWLRRLGADQVHACMEATGRLWQGVALHLQEIGHKVSVVNPVRIKRYAQSRLNRNKNDSIDALLIALFCREQNPPPWNPPSPAQRRLQDLTRLLLARKGQLQQERNRLKSGLENTVVRREIRTMIKNLTSAIRRLEIQIRAALSEDAEIKKNAELLCTIPGVSECTAAVILAELPDPKHFDKASQAAAYAGLTPAQNQSGSSLRGKTRLCKTGNRRLRQALYFPAIVASLRNPLLKARAIRLRAAGKTKMCVIGAIMHHLLRQAFAILKSQKPFNPDIHALAQAA
jgi:transposase